MEREYKDFYDGCIANDNFKSGAVYYALLGGIYYGDIRIMEYAEEYLKIIRETAIKLPKKKEYIGQLVYGITQAFENKYYHLAAEKQRDAAEFAEKTDTLGYYVETGLLIL